MICKDVTQGQFDGAPDIVLTFGNNQIVVTKDVYMQKLGSSVIFKIDISPEPDVWILGLPFFHKYDVEFDYSQNAVRLNESPYYKNPVIDDAAA